MAVSHVFARPSAFIIILHVVLILLLGSTSKEFKLLCSFSSSFVAMPMGEALIFEMVYINALLQLMLSSCVATFVLNLGPSHDRKEIARKLQLKITNCPWIKRGKIENISCPSSILTFGLWHSMKIYLLKHTITNNNFNIFTIPESWLDPIVCDADILISGYSTFRQDKGPHKRDSRLLVYVKNIFKACVIEKWSSVPETNFQQLWL